MFCPGDADDDFIQVPFVASARRAMTDAVGEFPPEFQAPLPDRLVRYRDAAGGLGYQTFFMISCLISSIRLSSRL